MQACTSCKRLLKSDAGSVRRTEHRPSPSRPTVGTRIGEAVNLIDHQNIVNVNDCTGSAQGTGEGGGWHSELGVRVFGRMLARSENALRGRRDNLVRGASVCREVDGRRGRDEEAGLYGGKPRPGPLGGSRAPLVGWASTGLARRWRGGRCARRVVALPLRPQVTLVRALRGRGRRAPRGPSRCRPGWSRRPRGTPDRRGRAGSPADARVGHLSVGRVRKSDETSPSVSPTRRTERDGTC
jgi:hypothetical protein